MISNENDFWNENYFKPTIYNRKLAFLFVLCKRPWGGVSHRDISSDIHNVVIQHS